LLLESLLSVSSQEAQTSREPHVVTVTGKAFYDIGHAPADHSNRRSTPKGYVVWEIPFHLGDVDRVPYRFHEKFPLPGLIDSVNNRPQRPARLSLVPISPDMEPLLNRRIQDFRSLSGYFVSLGFTDMLYIPRAAHRQSLRECELATATACDRVGAAP
jgi:hypothetical protein